MRQNGQVGFSAPEGEVIEPLLVPDRAAAEEAIAEREWRSQFHIEQPQRRAVADRVEKLLSVSVFNSYKVPKGAVDVPRDIAVGQKRSSDSAGGRRTCNSSWYLPREQETSEIFVLCHNYEPHH
jgi:hypothetical protein